MYSCGLVLEGGGNRAIYTSGVLDAFMDQGITFPYVIGVSAGSCNAVSYIGKCRGRQHDISTSVQRRQTLYEPGKHDKKRRILKRRVVVWGIKL